MSTLTTVIIVTYNGMEWIDRCLGSFLEKAGEQVSGDSDEGRIAASMGTDEGGVVARRIDEAAVPGGKDEAGAAAGGAAGLTGRGVLKSVSGAGVRVVVVDNLSTDGTSGYIRKYYPDAVIITPGSNLGFGRANNLAMADAVKNGSDYVFLLNQDAWVGPDTIQKLIDCHRENPGYGVLSPVHFTGEGDKLDYKFAQYCKEAGIDTDMLTDSGRRSKMAEIYPVEFVNAAAWLVSAECLRRAGGFHPAFFMYGEDSEYLNRVHFEGLKAGICPHAEMYHDRANRADHDKTEREIYFFGVKSAVTLCNVRLTAFEKRKKILDDLFIPFIVKLFRDPVTSCKILFRKLVILERARKSVFDVSQTTDDYRYLNISTPD